ncbi:hypothetical protein COY27_05890 [Candidatus Woesearchaeota archaeon CG_4_10_14_0_2_um_filter_33_13]|nr:MAG: hypothetical protein COY27_05890 [Candidatus Woesearchaeota archaeon CG_4_10_14_0_2_um_filter_33_13]
MDKKKVLITIAIAVIFALFIGYGIEVFHDSPNVDDFCNPNLYDIKNQSSCEQNNGTWQKYQQLEPKIEGQEGFCQTPEKCYRDYDLIQSGHDKIVFIACIIIGLIAIVAGILLRKEIIGTGFLSGGILVILYGTLRYWRYADEVLKFVLLGIVLAVLIWIGYKKIK